MPTPRPPATIEAEPVGPAAAELERAQRELDEIMEADFSDPTKLKLGSQNFGTSNSAYQYYLSIKEQLPDWWNEFANALDKKTGGPKYKSVRQFAISRTSNKRHQDLIVKMIGPEPAAYNQRNPDKNHLSSGTGKWLKVPWLGDWKSRRLNGYWSPQHPAKVKNLVKAIKEKLSGFEAVRSAAPFLVQMMAQYTKLSEQVNETFAGQGMDVNAGPSEANIARFHTYLNLQWALSLKQLRLLHEWYLAHGVSTNKEQVIEVHNTQVNQILQNNGQASMTDGMTNKQLEAIKLAQMLLIHEDNFKMPLPKDNIQPPEKPAERPKSNGKVM
jgi:hypothetical protein